jgi:hypothetical protein
MKFKHLEGAHVGPQATARIEFPEIAPHVVVAEDGSETVTAPWLEVKPAGEMNRAYTAAVLKQPDRARMLRGTMTTEQIKHERALAVPLYAEFILTGNGGGWVDGESDELVSMPLSVESRKALLAQLPADMFDRVRVFCNDLSNFRD